MVVVNIVGFPYKLQLKSGTIVVPNDNQPHEVPDEIANLKFDNVFKVIVPPKPKTVETPIETPKPVEVAKSEVQKAPEIIEIDIKGDEKSTVECKTEDKSVQEEKQENKQPLLKGVRIKSNIREKLIKRGKPRIKKELKIEEQTNANN